jgi:hypothetical protein
VLATRTTASQFHLWKSLVEKMKNWDQLERFLLSRLHLLIDQCRYASGRANDCDFVQNELGEVGVRGFLEIHHQGARN